MQSRDLNHAQNAKNEVISVQNYNRISNGETEVRSGEVDVALAPRVLFQTKSEDIVKQMRQN